MATGSRSVKVYHYLGVDTPFDPSHRYVTSYILSPLQLLLVRSLIALYSTVTLIITYSHSGATQFSYFTILSYWGIVSYFIVSTVHSLSFCRSLNAWRKSGLAAPGQVSNDGQILPPLAGYSLIDLVRGRVDSEALTRAGQNLAGGASTIERELAFSSSGSESGGVITKPTYPRSWLSSTFPRPLQFFHTLLVSTISTFPLIVTIVFWTLLTGQGSEPFRSTYYAWDNISVHAFNLMFSQLDLTILSRTPMRPWWHLLLVVILIACYVGVAYITYATQGFYTYDFLDIGKNGSGVVAAYIIGIGVGAVVSFMISQLVIFLREYLASKLQKGQDVKGWGNARIKGVEDRACLPTRRGPGPEGEGGRRRDLVTELRGRFDLVNQEALTNRVSSPNSSTKEKGSEGDHQV
ncbi:hypothetical protein IE53DRAFT_144999 [Violaceomyces palustris]|uniref:Uncharacterized protein n=1 Tax=Violaceomyces palustris TaxID=1673888 RepID=A0ACD0P6D9_9BASI|nr:hypothetical protein IE53DRAFT_144999 [Violaceomyces palustris]